MTRIEEITQFMASCSSQKLSVSITNMDIRASRGVQVRTLNRPIDFYDISMKFISCEFKLTIFGIPIAVVVFPDYVTMRHYSMNVTDTDLRDCYNTMVDMLARKVAKQHMLKDTKGDAQG